MQVNSLCKIKEGATGCTIDKIRNELNSEFLVKDRNMWGIIVDFLPGYYALDYVKMRILGIDKCYYFCYNDFNVIEEGDDFYQSDEIRQLYEQTRSMLHQ
jgi:hypothetical protein